MSLGITAAGWAAIGAVGTTAVSAYGSSKAAGAQKDAAAAAQASGDRQFDISRQDTLDRYAEQRADQAPYREAGKSALAQIMAGLNPGGQFSGTFDASSLAKDPGYQFRLSEGEGGIRRSAAASGAGLSGATLKALARFNSGLASQEYDAAFARNGTVYNRLAGVAGIGQTATNATQSAGTSATGQLNTLGTNYVNTTGANLGAMGEARASGYVANANAIGSGIKGLYNAYQAGPWTTSGSGAVDNTLF
jgi:hypothetical protein